jgi:hypothetical protein
MRYCPTDVMWADVLTKPLQGQKFRDMRGFLQNCSRSYDDNIELQTDKLVQKLLKPQVKTVASLRECVGERMKSTREKKGQNKSPCCVSWGDETRGVSHEKIRQGSTLCHAKTSLEGIQKQSHVAKPWGQKIQKIREDMFKWSKDM